MLNALECLTVKKPKGANLPLTSISKKPCFHYSPMKNLTIKPTSGIKDIVPIKAMNCNYIPISNYMFKFSNKNTRTRCEICSNLTIGVVLVSLLLTLKIFPPCSTVSIVNFEQVNTEAVDGDQQHPAAISQICQNTSFI